MNYSLRGKCKEYAEALCKKHPELRLVRGHYHCTMWGKKQHWWCEDPNGNIIDPTKEQFPSAGQGVYEEFDGWAECEVCGAHIHEDDPNFRIVGYNHPICSDKCQKCLIGL